MIDYSRSAAYFNGSQPTPVGRIQGSEAYQSYMLASLQDSSRRQHSQQEAKEIFTEALTSIRDEARRYTGDDSIRIGAISYPGHFDTSAFDDVFYTAEELDPDFDHIIRIRPSHYGAALTYPSDFCLEKWDEWWLLEEDDGPFVVMLEQSFGRLQIALATAECGTSILYSDTLPWPANQEDIQTILRKQLAKVELGEIAAIIISCEDPVADVLRIHRAIGAISPGLVHKIQVPVGGIHYVTAIGAGCIARRIALHPEMLEPLDAGYVIPDEEGYFIPEGEGFFIPEDEGFFIPEDEGFFIPEDEI